MSWGTFWFVTGIIAVIGIRKPSWGFVCLLWLAVFYFNQRPDWIRHHDRAPRYQKNLYPLQVGLPLPARSAEPVRLLGLSDAI